MVLNVLHVLYKILKRKKKKYKEMVLAKAVVRLESNNPGLTFQLCYFLAELSWPKHLNLSVLVYSLLKWQ